jgi:four helix bundle protein
MEGPIYDKSRDFSLRIIQLYKLMQEQHEVVISKQLLASATSIGANVHEASAACSRKDFINKMTIANKEARESKYWLELVKSGELINTDVSELLSLNDEIIKILTSIILTSKGKPRNRK